MNGAVSLTESGALPGTSSLSKPSDRADGDGELLVSAQLGNAEALAELARRHRNAAFVLALQMTRNPDDALDVSQEAMLKLLGHVGELDHERPVRPWLFAVVRNLVRDRWRRRKLRRHEPLAAEVGPDLGHQIVDERSASPEEDAVTRQTRRRLWRAVSDLPARHREILVLRDYHDLSYQELSQVLAIPLGTVMSRLHAARKKLRMAYLGLSPGAVAQASKEDAPDD